MLPGLFPPYIWLSENPRRKGTSRYFQHVSARFSVAGQFHGTDGLIKREFPRTLLGRQSKCENSGSVPPAFVFVLGKLLVERAYCGSSCFAPHRSYHFVIAKCLVGSSLQTEKNIRFRECVRRLPMRELANCQKWSTSRFSVDSGLSGFSADLAKIAASAGARNYPQFRF
jgi:hypothetical protein